MSLKQKKFQVFDIETKDYDDVHFIPAVVDGKEVEINNEFIKDQRIGDYEEFAKSRQARDSFDKDTSITEDLEVL